MGGLVDDGADGRMWVLATALVAAGTASLAWGYPVSQFDGGIVASAATFTLHGLLPYLDYWLLYGPLSGLMLAGPLMIAGPTVELLRILGLAVVVAQAALVALLTLRWTYPVAAAALAVTAVVTTPLVMGLELSAWSVAMTLALVALNLHAARVAPLFIGFVVGATFLTRLDVGGYLLAALLITSKSRELVTGFTLVVGPLVALLVAMVPFDTLIEQLLWYPLVGPREFRGMPGLEATMPGSVALFFSLALAVIPRVAILAGLVVAFRVKSGHIGTVAIFAAMCQLQTLGIPDVDHLAMASLPAILLIGAIIVPGSVRGVALVGAVVASTLVTSGLAIHSKSMANRDVDRDLVAAVAVTRAISDRDDRIFVGLTSNRFTAANPLIVYYLADRAPGTTTTMYNPGVTTTPERQSKMVRELTDSGTDILILSAVWSGTFEPWNASRHQGSDLLDAYVAMHFRMLCDFGSVRVAVRASATMPTSCPSMGTSP